MIPPRPITNPAGSTAKVSSRSGDMVTLKAKSPVAKNIWKVVLNGKTIQVKTAGSLTAGGLFSGRLTTGKNGVQVFTPVKSKRAVFHSTSFASETPIEKEIASLLQACNCTFDKSKLEWISKHLKILKKSNHSIRLLSQVYDKKIRGENIEDFTSSLYAFRENEDDNDREYGKQGRRDGSDQGDTADSENLSDVIKKQLKKNIPLQQSGHHSSVSLFNHLVSEDDNWILIPVGIDIDNIRVTGNLGLKYMADSLKILTLAIILDAETSHYGFSVSNWEGKNPVMRMFSEEIVLTHLQKKHLRIFSEKLTKLGINLDDNIKKYVNFDGFDKIGDPHLNSVDRFI